MHTNNVFAKMVHVLKEDFEEIQQMEAEEEQVLDKILQREEMIKSCDHKPTNAFNW